MFLHSCQCTPGCIQQHYILSTSNPAPTLLLERCCLQFGHEQLDAANSTLWFAGKQLLPEKKLSDYLGRHEKTKAVVKLQKKGSGAPAREPAVDADTQKAMMAWYYKKQEEQKKLAEDADDSHTGAAWASGTSLKSHFAGMQNVRIPR